FPGRRAQPEAPGSTLSPVTPPRSSAPQWAPDLRAARSSGEAGRVPEREAPHSGISAIVGGDVDEAARVAGGNVEAPFAVVLHDRVAQWKSAGRLGGPSAELGEADGHGLRRVEPAERAAIRVDRGLAAARNSNRAVGESDRIV